MKILHINTNQIGGAALCAMRINKALAQKGIDSRMLFAEGKTLPDGIKGSIATPDNYIWNNYRLLRFIKRILTRFGWWIIDVERMKNWLNKTNKDCLYLHQPLSSYKNIAHHPLVEWTDIIHLHWVSDFIDYPTFFKTVKKPIIWTLHDQYPAIGVQHFNSPFSPLPKGLEEIDNYCKQIKRKSITNATNLNIVAISKMMVNICKTSEVLNGFPITMIHNGVDTNIFRPFACLSVRQELGIISNAIVFLFSSYTLDDSRKGLDRIVEALEQVNIPNKILVCIGNIGGNYPMPNASFPIIPTGMIQSQERLAKVYSAADFFVQGSYEEAFAQTPLEAMACGTPVVSTPCSGASDLINEKNGVLCKGFDSDAIAEGIREAMGKTYDRQTIREDVIARFSYDKIAKEYIKLYKDVLAKI